MSRAEDVPDGAEDVPDGADGRAIEPVDPEMQACPKCRGEMVEGWIPRYRGEIPNPTQMTWQPGAPVLRETTVFFGHGHVTVPLSENPKQSLPISAFRCVRCGFLEFYAR